MRLPMLALGLCVASASFTAPAHSGGARFMAPGVLAAAVPLTTLPAISPRPAPATQPAPTTQPAARVAAIAAVATTGPAFAVATTRPAAHTGSEEIDLCGPAIRAMVATLRAPDDPDVSAAASAALSALGARAVPALAEAQRDPDAAVRRRVVAVAAAAQDPRDTAPLLASALHDADLSIRLGAIRALNAAKVREPCAIIAAARALSADQDPEIHQLAYEYLSDLGPGAAPAVPTLVKALDPDTIHVLAGIGPAARAALPALVGFYQDRAHATADRVEAVAALRRILTPPVPSTQPALSSAQ